MRLLWFSFFFFGFCLGAVLFWFSSGFSSLILQKIQTGNWQIDSPLLLFPPILMISIGYYLFNGGFQSEKRLSKEFLANLLVTDAGKFKYKDMIFGLTEFQIMIIVTTVITILAIVIGIIQQNNISS